MSTQRHGIESELIRRFSMCAWSHTGFYRLSDSWTFSAMNDGQGVAWRPPNPNVEILLLNHSRVDEMAAIAFTQEGKKYNCKEILGFIANKDWTNPDEFDCDQLVFWTAIQLKDPMLNHKYYPLEHLTPRDILLSLSIGDL
jgi:hypothetical protein